MTDEQLKKVIRNGATLFLVILISWSIYIVGGPSFNRELSIDKRTLDNIRDTKSAINLFAEKTSVIPNDLFELKTFAHEKKGTFPNSYQLSSFAYIFDKDIYNVKYKPDMTNSTYELCADFLHESKKGIHGEYYQNKMWKHPKGYHCFKYSPLNN